MFINPKLYQLMVIKSGLKLYLKNGMLPNRAYTLKALLTTASSFTGKPYTRKTAEQAIVDMQAIVDAVHPVNNPPLNNPPLNQPENPADETQLVEDK
jgi:hypothetical protein